MVPPGRTGKTGRMRGGGAVPVRSGGVPVRSAVLIAALIAAAAAAVFGVLIGLVVAHWPALRTFDVDVSRTLEDLTGRHSGYRHGMRRLTNLLAPDYFRALAAVAVVGLLALRRWLEAAVIVVVTAIGALAGLGAKDVVRRHRPRFAQPVQHFPGLSFPSGHAVNAAVVMTVLALVVTPLLPRRWRPVAIAVAVLLPAAAGWTRLALGAHYLSDVIAGLALGTAVAAAGVAIARAAHRQNDPTY